MPDYSIGLNRLLSAVAGGPGRELIARDLVGREEQRQSETDLNRQKIADAVAKRKREAELADPNALADVLAALGGIDRQAASGAIAKWSGASPATSGAPGAASASELDPDVLSRLAPIYAASRLGRIHGGKVDDVALARDRLIQGGARENALAAAETGDVDVMNRLASVVSGRPYEPYASGQHGVYSKASGELQDRGLYRADVAATNAMAGERGARRAQVETETANLTRVGAKEPGRVGSRAGSRETVYQQKLRVGMMLFPNAEDAQTPTREAAEYAAGRRKATYSEVAARAGQLAKAEGLIGNEYRARVKGLTDEFLAAEQGDEAGVARIRLENATKAIEADAPRIMKLTGQRRTRALEQAFADLKARGFTKDEALAVLTNAGLSDADGR